MPTIAWVYLPLLLSGAFGVLAPYLARRLPPHVGTWLLSAGSLVVALASSASLALLAFIFLAQTPLLVSQGHWSDEFLRLHSDYPAVLGAVAVVAVIAFSARFLQVTAKRARALRSAYTLARALPSAGGSLVVLKTPERQAFAVPGRPGRIVATTGMLRSLNGGERRALLAHEQSHLTHHHHLHQGVTALAVAINPLLASVPSAVELACERWADEEAALVCSGRDTVAIALGRAALGPRPTESLAVLAAGGADVSARIGALRAPAPRLQVWRVAALAGLLLTSTIAVAVALHDVERLFELAQSAYRAGQR